MKRRHRNAFTLVELLVVVSIIALLVSILLPSLQRAKDQAKQTKCLAHQKGLSTAALTYTTEENDWLPGSPGTTGSALLGQDWGPANVVELPRAPVQTFDWMGSLASVQMGMKLPSNRVEKWKQLVEGGFECPSNRFTAPSWEVTDPQQLFPNQRLISFNMMRNMLWWENAADAPDLTIPGDLVRPIHDQSLLPRGYQPRITRLGTPSEKIFVSDGSRFVDQEDPNNPASPVRLDYDADWNPSYGGAFADGGPTVQPQWTRSFKINEPAKFFSYRHRRGRKTGASTAEKVDKSNGLVAVYWDGHAEWMSVARSRLPNPWWPKGSKLALGDLNTKSLAAMSESVGGGTSNLLSLFENNLYEIQR